MRICIFDMESDGLLDKVTKLHCLSYQIIDTTDGKVLEKGTITDYNEIALFLLRQEVLVGHNIILYDIPVIEKILGIKLNCKLIDTIALSWYLYPERKKHGLEFWGKDLGFPKPPIEDWVERPIEEYINRCESDVEINVRLFNRLWAYMGVIYDYNLEHLSNFINYLNFKMDCAKEQQEVKCKIDIESVNNSLEELEQLKAEKYLDLQNSMPKRVKYKNVSPPNKMYKKDGSYSVAGLKWLKLLEDNSLPSDYNSDVIVIDSEELGNPDSPTQVKDWLFMLGWQPIEFIHRKNTKGEVKAVPQIYNEDKEVCDSIKLLYDIEPALENLDMYSLIKHRIGVFKGFLSETDENDFTVAGVQGFTNTLRFKHRRPIANLPKVFKFYGSQIRGAIISPDENHLLCGSDMSSLEDTTKQHYMYYFDPEYVTQMRVPGFDPHIDIGLLANMLTEEDVTFFKWYNKTKKEDKEYVFLESDNELFNNITFIRGKAKVVNFAGVYGAGPPKIAQSTGMPLEQAQQLHRTYWERNKAVKLVANATITKTVTFDDEESMWLYNPVSKFWYSLRFEKDKFSTLNQGTGVFCFDLWVREVRKRGIKITLQYHDEIAFSLLKEDKDICAAKLKEAIEAVNDKVKLNVPLGVSLDFGNRYSEIH